MLSFKHAVRRCLDRYATFSGRASRSEYWWFVVFGLAVNFVTFLFDSMLYPGAMIPISTMFSLLLLLPSLAVTVRRLHDIDRRGWWWWINLIPIVGTVVLVIFHSQPGTPGRNRFGPDPFGQGKSDTEDGYSPTRIPKVRRIKRR